MSDLPRKRIRCSAILTITDPEGLHFRPLMQIRRCASLLDTQVYLKYPTLGWRVPSLLLLPYQCSYYMGETVKLGTVGPNRKRCLALLTKFFAQECWDMDAILAAEGLATTVAVPPTLPASVEQV